jgi:hypothetical protein
VGDKGRPPDDPDVEIGAAARARRLRFRKKPRVHVETRAHLDVNPEVAEELDLDAEGGSRAERENLPDEVEPGVTYRNVRVGWRAGAALRHDEESADDR